jgi:hypothetical protein
VAAKRIMATANIRMAIPRYFGIYTVIAELGPAMT